MNKYIRQERAKTQRTKQHGKMAEGVFAKKIAVDFVKHGKFASLFGRAKLKKLILLY